jgi:hypothetical protein
MGGEHERSGVVSYDVQFADPMPGSSILVQFTGVLRGGVRGEDRDGEERRGQSAGDCIGGRTGAAESGGSAGEEESETFSLNGFGV